MKKLISCLTILFTLLHTSFASIMQEPSSLCHPDEACRNEGIGAKVPDPHDCHNYYLCIQVTDANGEKVVAASDNSFRCMTGDLNFTEPSFFNYSRGECESGTCINTENCSLNPDNCKLFCENDFDLFVNPRNCSTYFYCLQGGEVMEIECLPDKPYFNGVECVSDEFECCSVCTPYCYNKFSLTYNPYNCTSFYFCKESGVVPSNDWLYSCDEGEYFDIVSTNCIEVEGDPCQPLCQLSTSPHYNLLDMKYYVLFILALFPTMWGNGYLP